MIKYSILIPAYNAEKYIADTVERILKQEIKDFEIIIANDGSTDNTSIICNRISKIDTRVKVYDKMNEGLMQTRFFLYQKAKGKYCICCDADDLWEKDTLKVIDKYIEEYNPDMLMFAYNLWEAAEEKTSYKDISVDLPKLYDVSNFSELWEMLLCTDEINALWSKVILRSKIPTKWEIPIVSHGEDKLQLIEICKNLQEVLYIPDRLYNYRIDNCSMTRKFNARYFDDVVKTMEKVRSSLITCGLDSNNITNKFGCNLLELLIAYIDGAHRNDPLNEKALIEKYLKKDIVIQTINQMEYNLIPLWHRVMLFLIRKKSIKVITTIYDINHRLKGR